MGKNPQCHPLHGLRTSLLDPCTAHNLIFPLPSWMHPTAEHSTNSPVGRTLLSKSTPRMQDRNVKELRPQGQKNRPWTQHIASRLAAIFNGVPDRPLRLSRALPWSGGAETTFLPARVNTFPLLFSKFFHPQSQCIENEGLCR